MIYTHGAFIFAELYTFGLTKWSQKLRFGRIYVEWARVIPLDGPWNGDTEDEMNSNYILIKMKGRKEN